MTHLLKRTLTKGEVGCFLSHWRLWEEVADGDEPVLILEDDVVLKGEFGPETLKGGLTYLTYKEMLPNGVRDDRVCYPYWAAAYILSPKAASVLVETDADENIIPVDELLPRMTDRIGMTFVDLADQTPRSELGTNIEPSNHESYLRDFSVQVLTCGDDPDKMTRLLESQPDVQNISSREWKGGTMAGPGGGQKLNELKDWIETNDPPDHDVILFTDAFDVFYLRDVNEVVGRFLEAQTEVLFAAERYLWPDTSLRFPPCETPYRYLNSGCFIGRVSELKRILAEPIADHEDDQLYLQKAFLSGRYNIKLDTEQYVFMTNEPDLVVRGGAVFNPLTRCYGCIYHGNGGKDAKANMDRIWAGLHPETKYANLEVTDYKVIGNEMLLVDFLSPSQCEEWIRLGNEHGGWVPHEADKFPSHDIHLKLLGLYDEVDAWWSKIASRVFEKYWSPTKNYHLRKAFLMKYSEDTQKSLGHHNDASMVTGSVKLNDDYEGATLVFPRQEVTNQDIPIGKMILFPGQVTHGHYVKPLISGTKYSATFWSARYKGDLLED